MFQPKFIKNPKIGQRVRVLIGSGINSDKQGVIIGTEFDLGRKWFIIREDNDNTFSMIPSRLIEPMNIGR
jgi:hypothetical protein